MRPERWWQDTSVIDELFESAGDFEFIQATRLLRHVPYKMDQKSWSHAFHFDSSLNLNFPATEIEKLTVRDDDTVALTNLVVGLTGMQGAMPYTYTNKINRGSRQQKQEVQAFLGLFNHTLTAQYVDASLAYNLPVRYEVEEKADYLDILHALNGYVSAQHEQQNLDEYFAEFSGLMQGQNNTAHALKTMLGCVFNQKVRVKEFIKEKFFLSDEHKTCLGLGGASLLGINTFCGDSIEQLDGKIEIEIGPLARQDYLKFLPEQPASQKLKDLLQTWCSPTLLVDVRLILSRDDIQPLQLHADASTGLGQGSFLYPSDQAQDNHETCYALIGATA